MIGGGNSLFDAPVRDFFSAVRSARPILSASAFDAPRPCSGFRLDRPCPFVDNPDGDELTGDSMAIVGPAVDRPAVDRPEVGRDDFAPDTADVFAMWMANASCEPLCCWHTVERSTSLPVVNSTLA